MSKVWQLLVLAALLVVVIFFAGLLLFSWNPDLKASGAYGFEKYVFLTKLLAMIVMVACCGVLLFIIVASPWGRITLKSSSLRRGNRSTKTFDMD